MASPRDIEKLIARWRAIEARQGNIDHDIAAFAADVGARLKTDEKVRAFFWGALGVRSGVTIAKYCRMAEALLLVPDQAVWRAVRWEGVREIARIESRAKRRAACARVLAEPQKLGRVGIEKVLAEIAPEIYLPSPAIPTTKKDREQDRMAKARPDAVDLAAAIRRVAGLLPFVADLLTDDERKAAGLPAAKRKASAS